MLLYCGILSSVVFLGSKRVDDKVVEESGQGDIASPYYQDAKCPEHMRQEDKVLDYYLRNREGDCEIWNEVAKEVDPRDMKTPDEWCRRHPELIRLTGRHPFNCEPPLKKVVDKGFITPASLQYVRTHGATPNPKWEDWKLRVGGVVPNRLTLTMADVVALPRETVAVTLVCCGNRRKEQNMIKQTIGFNWGAAGVSNSLWSGVQLHVLLRAAGVTSVDQFSPGHHVRFASEHEFGGDNLPNGVYGTSVPLSKALDPSQDILICYMCNGRLLHHDHGFPLRVIVPGYIGGRMIKWLTHVDVLPNESQDYYHFYDNRVMPPHVDAELAIKEDWWHDPNYICNDLSVNSAISAPDHDEVLPLTETSMKGTYKMRGYAYTGGGRRITRVEVSLDSGHLWRLAKLVIPERATKYGKYWCWMFWEFDVPVSELADLKVAEVTLRAHDEGHNSQPAKPTWNLMGMLNNPYFRIKVHRVTGANGLQSLQFEHPTMAGAQPGGWMVRAKGSEFLTHPDAWNPHHSSGTEAVKAITMHMEETKKEVVAVPVEDDKMPPMDKSKPNYTMAQVAENAGQTEDEPVWIVVRGRVFDCAPFLKAHPGGSSSITICAGEDATEDFEAVHSSKGWKLLMDYYIGNLAEGTVEVAKVVEKDVTGKVGVALNPKLKLPFTLQKRVQLTHDSLLLRYALQTPTTILGLPIGQHMFFYAEINNKLVMRAYTPTSSDLNVGYFDLVIKVYNKTEAYPEGGLMSQYLGAMKVGDSILVKGPMGHVTYESRGQLSLNHKPYNVTKFACICGGTGITPIWQIIEAVLRDDNDKSELFLLYANRTEDDILLGKEIDVLAALHPNRLKVRHTLSQPKDSAKWTKGSDIVRRTVGRVDEDMIKQFMPQGGDGVFALLCGPPGLLDIASKPNLLKYGYLEHSFVEF